MDKKRGKLRSYHFDCGNSTDGHIGFCGRVRAKTKKEALEIMKRVLPTEITVRPIGSEEDNSRVEYIEIYVSPDNIKIRNIDDWEEA